MCVRVQKRRADAGKKNETIVRMEKCSCYPRADITAGVTISAQLARRARITCVPCKYRAERCRPAGPPHSTISFSVFRRARR